MSDEWKEYRWKYLGDIVCESPRSDVRLEQLILQVWTINIGVWAEYIAGIDCMKCTRVVTEWYSNDRHFYRVALCS